MERDIQIEWDEDGCYIIIDGDSVDPDYQAGCYRWRVEDPEQLYDRVKGAIGPWLRERDEARATLPNDFQLFACETIERGSLDDHFYSVHADLWDARAGK